MKQFSCVVVFLSLFFIILSNSVCTGTRYEPTWDSLDKRPLPQWFDDVKIGIFIHWGVFSVPSFVSEWFWWYWKGKPSNGVPQFMEANYPKGFTYQDFGREFTAEFYDPVKWAKLFKAAGARYVVLTSKHHEGFTLWPSKYSFSWNAMDVGPHLDLVGELAEAIRAEGLHFGLYHSFFEWFNPMFNYDVDNNYTTQQFMVYKCTPEMHELVEKYKPEIFWSDGDGYTDSRYWNSTHFLAWLYNDSPVNDTVVVNDRWGTDTSMKHGDFFSGPDRYNPGTKLHHKFESTLTIDKKSWGYRRNADIGDFLSTYEILEQLVVAVSCGGNMLINIGPTKDGLIAPIFQERLLDLGAWLSVNGEGIYESKPWTTQSDSDSKKVWYTSKNSTVYAFILEWPTDDVLTLHSASSLFNPNTNVTLLGYSGQPKWNASGSDVSITFPKRGSDPAKWIWTFKIVSN